MIARRADEDPPHLVYLPERPFDRERFLDDVADVHAHGAGQQRVLVVGRVVDARGQHHDGRLVGKSVGSDFENR